MRQHTLSAFIDASVLRIQYLDHDPGIAWKDIAEMVPCFPARSQPIVDDISNWPTNTYTADFVSEEVMLKEPC